MFPWETNRNHLSGEVSDQVCNSHPSKRSTAETFWFWPNQTCVNHIWLVSKTCRSLVVSKLRTYVVHLVILSHLTASQYNVFSQHFSVSNADLCKCACTGTSSVIDRRRSFQHPAGYKKSRTIHSAPHASILMYSFCRVNKRQHN